MLRFAAALAGLAAFAAGQDTWLGLIPGSQANAVTLIYFDDSGAITRTAGSVSLQAGESVQYNAFRCGVGFCLFATATAAGSSAVYNISWADASVTSRTAFPGAVIHNLHMDASTGDVVTVVQYADGRRQVAFVQLGQLVPVLDITAVVGNGIIHHGGTTHCSALQTLYVGIDAPDRESDRVIAVNLVRGFISSTITLRFPILSALWANCSAGLVGGVTVFSNGEDAQTAVIAAIPADGSLQPLISDPVPAPPASSDVYQLSGILTASETYTYAAPLYPGGSTGGTGGLLWLPTPSNGGESYVPINFYLLGAAQQW